MKDIKKFIKKHKKGCLIGLIVFIIILLIILIKVTVFPSASGDKYGVRLKNIDKYKITEKTISKIEDKITEKSGVEEVTYKLEGRIMNFVVTVDGVDKEDSKTIATIVTDNIDDDEKGYYDIQIFIKSKSENEDFPIIGYKHKSSDSFSWSNN